MNSNENGKKLILHTDEGVFLCKENNHLNQGKY